MYPNSLAAIVPHEIGSCQRGLRHHVGLSTTGRDQTGRPHLPAATIPLLADPAHDYKVQMSPGATPAILAAC